MLLRVFRTNSRGVQEATKAVCLWASKDLNVTKCRPYHTCKKINWLLTKDALRQTRRPFRISKCSSSTVPKSESHHDVETEEVESSEPVDRLDDTKDFYEKHNITLKGEKQFRPFFTVEDANFPQDIARILRNHNLTTPTPIQSVTWPLMLKGRDFVGISPTGSGKTLAYGVPMIMKVKELASQRSEGNVPSPIGLILAPTRELAQQILTVLLWFTGMRLRYVAAYGGLRKDSQLQKLERGVDILIATPGRCNDLLESCTINLDRCSFLVLDEADRMLDMGFLPQIEPIIESIPNKRQSVMWSATWPKEVKDIARKFLTDYVEVTVGSVDLKPNKNVKQNIVMCVNTRDKVEKCNEFLSDALQSPDAKILIFVKTKFMVDSLQISLQRNGFSVKTIHGGKSQNYRDNTLRNFRTGNTQVLIATAVAARGLDIDDVTHVVNFDCPDDCEEYIHKIGRTGRMNKKGESITFVTDDDVSAGYLIEMLRSTGHEVPEELYQFQKGRKPPPPPPSNRQQRQFRGGSSRYGDMKRFRPKYGSY